MVAVVRISRHRRAAGVAVLVGGAALLGVAEVWGKVPVGARAPGSRGVLAAALLALSVGTPSVAAVTATWRWPIISRRWRRRLRAHAAMAAGATAVAGAAELAAHATVPWTGAAFAPSVFGLACVWYVLWAVVAHAAELARRVRRARAVRLHLLRALERADRERVAAQRRAVRTELPPVLIANALATAQALVRTDPAAAERVVVELGLLMRDTVAGASTDAVCLGDEVDAARDRSGDGDRDRADAVDPAGAFGMGTVRYVVDEEVRDALVPHLVIPLLLACAEEAGWGAGGVLVRGRALGPTDAPAVELMLTAVTSGARTSGALTPRIAARAPTTPHAAAALRRLLYQFYGSDAPWQLTTAAWADDVPTIVLVLPQPADTPAGTPPVLAPARHATADVSADVWAVAGAGAVVSVAAWSGTHMSPPADATARAVLSFAASFGVALVGLGVAAVAASRRWPVGVDERLGRAIRAHLAVGCAVAVGAMAWRAVARGVGHEVVGAAVSSLTVGEVGSRVLVMLLLYVLFVIVAHVAVLGNEHRRTAQVVDRVRAAHRSSADGQRRNELRALKAELNPHFVGNALHTAAALIGSAPDTAGQLLASLGALASEAGTRIDVQEVSLLEEIAGLEPFLALERARLGTAGGSLSLVWEVAAEATDAAVPHLILQPLVENAVRHGLAPRGGAGRLTIRAARAGRRLELAVADDGVGLTAASPERSMPALRRPGTGGVGQGAGLRGVRQRLALLYGSAAAFTLEPDPSGGTVARITLPYRRIDPTAAGAPTLAAAGG